MSERSDAGDVAGEEVDAGSVEVAPGSVVVLVGAGVCLAFLSPLGVVPVPSPVGRFFMSASPHQP